jgi:hypothetical protein
LAFSPDATTLAAGDPPGVRFWDVPGQRECGQAALPLTYVQSLAFSPDGKSLAAVGGFEGNPYLVEVSTAQVRARLEGHEGRLQTVAFSPDGKLLVTGGDDGTPLVWDVTGAVNASQGRGVKLSDRELAACWEALAGEDAGKAWGAVRRLAAAPAQGVPFLRAQLAKQDAEAGKLRRLITDLDSESFEARERASRELAALGKAAGPALRRAQEGGSAEVRRRAKALLDRLDVGGRSGEELRGLRAVEVLEYVGTADARQGLAGLAAGPAEARLTREAKAALRRLAGRAASGS